VIDTTDLDDSNLSTEDSADDSPTEALTAPGDQADSTLEEVAFSLEWKSMTVMPTETASPIEIVDEIGGMPSPAAGAQAGFGDAGAAAEPADGSSDSADLGTTDNAG